MLWILLWLAPACGPDTDPPEPAEPVVPEASPETAGGEREEPP